MDNDQLSAVAVIKTGGKQFLVSPGDIIKVERLSSATHTLTDLLRGTKVPVEVVKTEKLKKIRVLKFRAKTRYKRHHGHRQLASHLRIGNFTKS